MRKILLISALSFLMMFKGFATTPPDEGMWLPMLVDRLNYVDMKEKGLQLTAEELYSINNASIKDAIVSMGFFCTGELVSDQGLYITNHHCGYGAIQELSSTENDYLTDGFWAKKKEQELPVEDLTVYILEYMDDVTAEMLRDVTPDMTEQERNDAIKTAKNKMQKEKSEDGKFRVDIKSFFNGNEYYMFVYNQYRDVRLAGAPPSAIGKYGGDTDNWMWPRHTGDFSMFRIYVDKDGNGADYSKDNIPFKPKHFLPVSLKGVEKNDFAMIWGFPGSTDRYLTSYGIEQALKYKNPTTVEIRDRKLKQMKKHMNASDEVRIKYAAKYAQTANYWKYFKGQSRGLKRLDVYKKKKAIEDRFTKFVNSTPELKEEYGSVLSDIAEAYKKTDDIIIPMTYYNEAVFQGPEFIMTVFQSMALHSSLKKYDEAKKDDRDKYVPTIEASADAMKAGIAETYKDYDMATDKDIFIALMEMFFENVSKENAGYYLEKVKKNDKGKIVKADTFYLKELYNDEYDGDIKEWAEEIYEESIFVDSTRLKEFLNEPDFKTLDTDPAYKLVQGLLKGVRSVYGEVGAINASVSKAERLLLKGLRELDTGKKYYPDANSTLRMTYGEVLPYKAADAVYYDFKTTLEGVMEKEDPNSDEFIVPDKLKELYREKDYGRYADEDGNMYVCFLTTNDITGGNSGSPVINGKGHLIGVAFDGNWEAMSGDIFFENEIQRTINVDIRYVLFIVEKLGGAHNLINEMEIIE